MFSKTPDLLAFSTKDKRQVLSQSQLDTLKTGTYQILEEVGVRFPIVSLPISPYSSPYIQYNTIQYNTLYIYIYTFELKKVYTQYIVVRVSYVLHLGDGA